jgi:enoyl-CoA hydratase/carnithine racemase
VAYEQITHETDDDVAIITLNRPDRLNAWTPQMLAEMTAAVGEANADDRIGAIVFTGAGRGFCAGADIGGQFKAQLDGAPPAEDRPARAGHRPTDWVDLCRSSKPMVAAINGPAVGIGLTLVLPMDQLVASDQAKLSCRFVKMGITPELASSHFLVQRCGWGAASDLALSGRMVDAAEALHLGLVDVVAPHEQLLATALAKAREYGANPGPQLRMVKRLLTENAVESDLAAVQRRELAALAEAYTTPEFAEAVNAFLEKRPARFR